MSDSSDRHFDVIVLGLGGWGSAALYHLARRGLRVCGIEQHRIGHDLGSSHGDSRIIRMAYFMHPDYVPVLRRAYTLWRELEQETHSELMNLNGLLCLGEPDSSFIKGLEHCYAEHRIEHERISAAEAMRRFPQFSLPEETACYVDPHGGFLRPEGCIRAHLQGARNRGALITEQEQVLSIEQEPGGGVTVRTVFQTLRAAKVVVAAGAYTNTLLEPLGSTPIQAVRKVLFWYAPKEPAAFAPERFPTWIAKFDGLNFYGFPTLNGTLVKAAEDTGGQPLESPATADATLQPEDEAQLRPFLDRLFPGALDPRVQHKVCRYEVSADRNFIVDIHPRAPDVIVTAGGSGHGYKFCSVIGEMAAELAQHGTSPGRPPIFAGDGRL